MTARGSRGSAASPWPAEPQRRRIATWALSAAGVSLILLVWELTVRLRHIPLYILPPPSTIYLQLLRDWPLLMRHLQPTAIEAAGGFLIGNLVAILLATTFVHSAPLERTL